MSRRVAPPVEAPAFASILTSQDTYLNSATPLSVVGSGGGGGSYPANPSFSTIAVLPTPAEGGVVFAVEPTRTYQKGADFYLYQNGVSAYNPRIVFNSGSGTATIEANTPASPSGVVIQSTLTTSALNVSSINGAIPGTGGTVPPNLTLSTLNVSSMITTSSITTTQLLNVAVLEGRPEVGNGLDIISAGNLNLIPSVDPTFGIYASGAFLSTPYMNISSLEVYSINSEVYPPALPADIAANSITLTSSINITAAGTAAANPVIQTLGSTLGDFTNGVYYVNVIKYGTCKKTYLSGYIPNTNPNFFTTSLTIPSLAGLAGNWTSSCTVSVSIMVMSPDSSSRSGYLTFQVVGVNTNEWTLSANQSLSAAPQTGLAFSIANQSSVDGPVLSVSNSAGPNTTRAPIYVSIEVTQVLISP